MYSSVSYSASPPPDKKESLPRRRRRGEHLWAALLLGLTLLAAPAQAQERPAPALVRVDFKEAPLEDLVRFMARLTGRSFLVDPAVAGRRVTWLAPRALSPQEAWEAFTVTLAQMGLVVQRQGRFYRVAPASQGQLQDPDLELVPVRHADAASLAALLRQLAPPQDKILVSPDGRGLILVQPPARRRRSLAVLRALDRPGAQPQAHLYPLQHADAATLAALLRQIYGAPGL